MSDIGNIFVSLVGGILALAFLAVYVYSVVWAYSDAEQRGKSGCLVALLVFLLTWPVGLIIWLLIRPENKKL